MPPKKPESTATVPPARKMKAGYTLLKRKKALGLNGCTACIFIPVEFMEELHWKAKETVIVLSITEKGELLATRAEKTKEKAS